MAFRSVRRAGLVAALVVVPSTALAQEAPPAESTEAAAPAAPATPAPASQPPPEPPNDGHFRWGLSPLFGTFFPGPTTVALGFEVRLGWAFNQTVTVYGNGVAVGGFGFGADADDKGGSIGISAISFWQLGANIDALLAGPLFAGGGVGIGKAGWGVLEAHGSDTSAGAHTIAAGGFAPSLDGRIGISTGSPNPQTGKRTGFYLALDVRVLFAPNATETRQEANASGSQQSVVTDTFAVGVSPMLHIGFDQR